MKTDYVKLYREKYGLDGAYNEELKWLEQCQSERDMLRDGVSILLNNINVRHSDKPKDIWACPDMQRLWDILQRMQPTININDLMMPHQFYD